MAGRVAGKVAFITGAARGQGRSHAVKLAQEGADIIAVDIGEPVQSAEYPMASDQDLHETVGQVEALGRQIYAAKADVRDYDGLSAALAQGVEQFGRLDIVSANAGIFATGTVAGLDRAGWQEMIDINLTGVWHTAKASIPHLLESGAGGSIIITSSAAGLKGFAGAAHYVTAKHGLVGLMRTMCAELAPHKIRVNSLHSTNVNTPMIQNEAMYRLFAPDLEDPTAEDFESRSAATMVMPVPWLEPIDVSNALLFLASDEARYITGVTLPIDAGRLSG